MTAIDVPLASLTAADLMTPVVVTLPAALPLREAVRELVRAGVHGAPVVDDAGRCVGVWSVSDLARWAARGGGLPEPRACDHQDVRRKPGGREVALCRLHAGACPLQVFRDDGRVGCADPHGVGTDWQVVEAEQLPPDEVRHHMTTELVTAAPEQPVPEVARTMLGRGVRRVVVTDADRRPVGVVSVTDILRAVADARA